MINFHKGSHLHRLIALLSVTGEFPTSSLYLLGNERMYKRLVAELTEPTAIRDPETGTKHIFPKVVNISGKGKYKTVRLYKGALSLLQWIDADKHYSEEFRHHRFSGDSAHIERNHRIAETLAMFMGAGYEFRNNKLLVLQNKEIQRRQFTKPSFYNSRYIKRLDESEANKTDFTRFVGAVIAGNKGYAVYNTRNAVMKWCGAGESKTKYGLESIVRMNAETKDLYIDSAILLGKTDEVAMKTIQETERNRKLQLRFDAIYPNIYFVPLNETGMRQLRLFTIPNWQEKLSELLFEEDELSHGRGCFDYDAYSDGAYVLSYLDGDIAKLMRFKYGMERRSDEKFEVICFEDQVSFVRKYFGNSIRISVAKRDKIEKALNLNVRDIFDDE